MKWAPSAVLFSDHVDLTHYPLATPYADEDNLMTDMWWFPTQHPTDFAAPPTSVLTHWGRDKMAAIFQTTFSNEFSWMKMLEFRLKFVPKGPINNIPLLVQIMAWRLPGDTPLSEQMVVRLLMHICVSRPQWVKLNYHWVSVDPELSLSQCWPRSMLPYGVNP